MAAAWQRASSTGRLARANCSAASLEARGAALDAACYLEVPDDELWRRLLGRGRADDDERVIRHRLAVFANQTRPLVDHYRHRGRLVLVDGVGPPEAAGRRILHDIAALAGRTGR